MWQEIDFSNCIYHRNYEIAGWVNLHRIILDRSTIEYLDLKPMVRGSVLGLDIFCSVSVKSLDFPVLIVFYLVQSKEGNIFVVCNCLKQKNSRKMFWHAFLYTECFAFTQILEQTRIKTNYDIFKTINILHVQINLFCMRFILIYSTIKSVLQTLFCLIWVACDLKIRIKSRNFLFTRSLVSRKTEKTR